MNGIDAQAQEYIDNLPLWEKVRDCVAGSANVKKRTETYLPQPSPSDKNPVRYSAYLLRANFFNATARTLEGLIGAVWRKPGELKLPSKLKYMEKDADGSGCSIEQCAKQTLSDVIQIGRAGLLVDFPLVDGEIPVTVLDEESLNLRASIIQYKAENIINWREIRSGAETILQFVVLKESQQQQKSDSIFETESVTVYRVLALDEQGNYYQEEYIASIAGESGKSAGLKQKTERSYPKFADGSSIKRIPFIFIGSKDLKPTVDKSPLLDIAEINLSHYRNSADFEEMTFMIGQPTLVITGLTPNWIDQQWKNQPVKVGARSSIELPQGANAVFAQISESQIGKVAMDQKEQQMIAIGARLIWANPAGVEAAETIALRHSGEAGILANITDNVEEGYRSALMISALFMGANPEEVVFELNKDFFAKQMTPDEARAWSEMWQKGVFSLSDLRLLLRKGELISEEKTDEQIDEEINSENTNFPSIDDGETD